MSYIKKELLLADILDAKIKNTRKDSRDVLDIFEKMVQRQPDVDVVEVKHGHWIQTSEPKFIEGIKRIAVECSVCKIRRNIPAVENHGYYYCPNCGVKMDK